MFLFLIAAGKLFFRIVGHTDEDVDQLFSRVSIQGNKAIKTLDLIHAEIH